MALLHAQKLSLKAALLADATELPFSGGTQAVSAVMAAPSLSFGDAQLIAERYNALANPEYTVYRPSVPLSEIMLNGFDWTRVDNLSIGKARIWDWMFQSTQSIDPSKPNIRAGINAVWVGTAADLAVRAAVYLHCQRSATLAEKVLASGGSGTPANASGDGPATLGYNSTAQGLLTADTIQDIHGILV